MKRIFCLLLVGVGVVGVSRVANAAASVNTTNVVPNLKVLTNATTPSLTVTTTNWTLPMPASGLLGGTAGGAVGVMSSKRQIGVTIGDGVNVISTGPIYAIRSPWAMRIEGWDLVSTVSGSIVLDVWKGTYSNFPPTVADTIFGTKPALSSEPKNQASGLSISVAAGDWIVFNVDSASIVTRVILALYGDQQ